MRCSITQAGLLCWRCPPISRRGTIPVHGMTQLHSLQQHEGVRCPHLWPHNFSMSRDLWAACQGQLPIGDQAGTKDPQHVGYLMESTFEVLDLCHIPHTDNSATNDLSTSASTQAPMPNGSLKGVSSNLQSGLPCQRMGAWLAPQRWWSRRT
jgi:hypothetical protein